MESLTTELMLLGWGVVLLCVQIGLQGQLATRERGLDWNAGPRDGQAKPLGTMAARAQRCVDNYKETFPAFAALALGLAVTGRSGGIGEIGAWLWFVARIAYIPLYLFGVPVVRSMAFGVSMLGILLMLIRFF